MQFRIFYFLHTEVETDDDRFAHLEIWKEEEERWLRRGSREPKTGRRGSGLLIPRNQ